jgi:NNP family nitrate/nitrite transporter-like MFS transporter
MSPGGKATKIKLFDFQSLQMRTFHLSWLAFFICFFGWFAHAPLMNSTISVDLNLSKDQILTAFMASVGVTIFARILVGYFCDRFGPRMTYVVLLIFGAIAVASSSFAYDWPTFLLSSLFIGVIGASFVITQYHTSVMFSANCVGLANATTAGWGNMGGGVTQAAMPMIAAGMITFGFTDSESAKWRAAMWVPAFAMLVIAFLYWKFTKDCPEGNYKDLADKRPARKKGEPGIFLSAIKDHRVWILFLIYGGCFGMELFINGRAATYYQTRFELDEKMAGVIAALFGLTNIFARSLGGYLGDRFALRAGLSGRVRWLVVVMIAAGLALLFFSRMGGLALAISSMLLFSTSVQMTSGATFSVVPFINKKAMGVVAGIVGAGGNVGAVCYAQFLRTNQIPLQDLFFYLGIVVSIIAFLGLFIRFSAAHEKEVSDEIKLGLNP